MTYRDDALCVCLVCGGVRVCVRTHVCVCEFGEEKCGENMREKTQRVSEGRSWVTTSTSLNAGFSPKWCLSNLILPQSLKRSNSQIHFIR